MLSAHLLPCDLLELDAIPPEGNKLKVTIIPLWGGLLGRNVDLKGTILHLHKELGCILFSWVISMGRFPAVCYCSESLITRTIHISL